MSFQFGFQTLKVCFVILGDLISLATTLHIWRISNTLDLQHVHMFIFNPMIHVANTNLGIEFEHMNMLKIQSVWNSSDTFAFILSQQRPGLVSAHAQNFFSWSSAKIEVAGKCKLLSPKDRVKEWVRLQMKAIYLIYNFVERPFFCESHVLKV